MKTTELYLKVLKEVRYGKLSENYLKLGDYEIGSDEYEFIAQYNKAMNLISDLINIMEFEKEVEE